MFGEQRLRLAPYIEVGAERADEAARFDGAHQRGDFRVQQRLGPVVETDRLDAAFAQRLVQDAAEEAGAHQPARPLAQCAVTGAHKTGRAAQIAVEKNVDVEDEALLRQSGFIRYIRHLDCIRVAPCPALCRASTSSPEAAARKGVGGRNKSGHGDYRNQSGVRVDCQATICHWPPLLTQTSVKRTPKFMALPPEFTLMRALPVRTTVSPRSCAFTSEGTTAV